MRELASRCVVVLVLLAFAVAASACGRTPIRVSVPVSRLSDPIVKQQLLAPTRGAIQKIALLQVAPRPGLSPFAPRVSPPASEVAARLDALLLEAFVAQGFAIVSPAELRQALPQDVAAGSVTPQQIAQLVGQRAGVTGILVTRLDRWRDRDGGAVSVKEPASVAFEASLFTAKGRRVWTGVFSETQRSADQQPGRAARYPGRGTRWLTADELARWGAGHLARALRATPAPGQRESGRP